MLKTRGVAWAAVAALLSVGCQQPAQQQGARVEPTTATAERRDIVGYLRFDGEVVIPPAAQAEVMPRYRAPVEKIEVEVGQRVNRGQTLVTLAIPDAQAMIDQARLNLRSAEQALAQARAQYDTELRAARQELEQAREAERASRRFAQDDVVGTDLQAATEARQLAEARVRSAEAEVNRAVSPYQIQVDAAREALQEAQAGARIANIRSPIAGTVMAINVQPGELLEDAARPVATVVDLDQAVVHIPLGGEAPEELTEGRDVKLVFVEIPNEEFEGRVDRITTLPAEANAGLRRVAVVTFTNRDGLIKPGIGRAMVLIEVGEVKDVLTVPVEAVGRDGDGRAVVRVQRDGQWATTVVEAGLTDLTYIEIRSGLQPGEIVQVPYGT
jgi:HlyD family secretion protein